MAATAAEPTAPAKVFNWTTVGFFARDAGLDVFEKEPHVPERLRELENVVLLPHQGSATHKTRAAMGQMVVKNLKAHLKGEPLISPVV